ncbi:GumC family protein [Roseivirga sp.]|uniref:GumC family protein n=1 Tax=Roseivirga sp. TaxID=1964215 RepID=UPI003B8B7772
MSLLDLIRLIVRYFWHIAGTAIILTLLVFFSTKNDKKEYATHTLLNTGLISGYSIESSSSGRIDYAKTNNELENLINLATAYETHKELSARLLAFFLLQNHNESLEILPENYSDFRESIKNLPISVSDRDNEESILYQIIKIRDRDNENSIYDLINSKNPFFGLEQLSTLTVSREGNSDMIRMEYSSIDPRLSQKTLSLLTDIFITQQKENKEGQTDSVIGFFKDAVDKSDRKLKGAEDELLKFRVSNQIINYYEQTRFISGNKQELDRQYQEELKILAGSKSALLKVEAEIVDKQIIPQLQSRIAFNRSEISKQTAQLTQLELINDTTFDESRYIRKSNLGATIDSLKTEMTSIASELILVNQTSEGVETKDLLTNWLNQVIIKEESAAKLQVMDVRKREYEKIYDRFAPLGSTLKRLEREIDVAERAYLENLHSYNQARLHKYSSLMSSNLKVIDSPYYPDKPLKSKRMMMVILAFLVGLVLPLGILITLELTDSSLKNPENAGNQTKLKVAGVLSKQPANSEKHMVDFPQLNKQALNLLVQELRAKTSGQDVPREVILLSTQHGEGKTLLAESLKAYFERFLSSSELQIPEFTFKEIDAILHEPYAQKDLQNASIHLLVTRANRKWTAADKHAVKVYSKLAGQKPLLFLNGVSVDVMEDIIGEIPKRRTWLRMKVRQLLTQGFKPATI